MTVTSLIDKPKGKSFYCKKNDVLKVISVRDEVLIVEFNNQAFSIRKIDTK